jgi:hypothetical protein
MQRLACCAVLVCAAAANAAAQDLKPAASLVTTDPSRASALAPPVAPKVFTETIPAKPARFTFIGVRRAEDCGPALIALQKELETLEYPQDWTFKIACTSLIWERVQRKADHPGAAFAISELKHKITFFNASVFREARVVYRRAMSHELGHIRCGCKNEDEAEKWARQLEQGETRTALH